MGPNDADYGDAVGQYQIIWPWTWYNVLKYVVEDDVGKGGLIVVSLIFWFTLPKYGPNPMDRPLTEEHLNGA